VTKKRIRLIHWKEAEAKERAALLKKAGFDVHIGPTQQAEFKALRADPPAAFVIDLGRLPSHGREVGLALRTQKGTRHVPLVFVGGDPDKVTRIRELLPDAVYTGWDDIASALRQAITQAPADPVVPESKLAGYSGTPLPKKLGIKANTSLLLINAPEDFEATLGTLPDGVSVRRQARGQADLVIWFTMSRRELEDRLDFVAKMFGPGGLWIAWPKKASGLATDVSEPIVRETGLAAGLVDYKICAIDAVWSGLRFARRKL
jgi:hypothetical protein